MELSGYTYFWGGVFYNGNVVTTTFAEVKQRLWG